MIQPNLPKVNIINGFFEPIKLIEYNKPKEFYLFSETETTKEVWLPNSITLNKRIVTCVDYIADGTAYLITGLKVDLKEDGLYVGGENISNIEDGEYSIGYQFRIDEEMWNTDPYERKISKGTIYGVSLIKD